MKKVAAVIFLSLLMQRTDGFVFSNAMDGVMDFKCPPHQFISYVGGHHDNHYEDRQYEFRCTDVPVAEASFTQEICAWTASFVNNFDEPVIFECSNSGYLSGVYSEHDNRYEDRRFKFYCCSIPGYHMDDCEYSGQVNQYDGPMAYSLPTGKVMKGAVSVHDNGHEYYGMQSAETYLNFGLLLPKFLIKNNETAFDRYRDRVWDWEVCNMVTHQ